MLPNLSNLSNLSKLSLEESNRPRCLPCGLDTMVNLQAATWPCDEDGNCAICFETLNKDSPSSPFVGSGSFIVAVCSNQHIYHKGCILQYIYTQRVSSENPTCPECRNPVDSESVYKGWDDRFTQSVEKGELSEIKEQGDDEEEDCNTDERDPTRKLQRDTEDDGGYKIWEGKRNSMRLIEEFLPRGDGKNRFFEGPTGEERMVRELFPNGVEYFYEGPIDQERFVRAEFPDGTKQFYEGPIDQERLVRVELSDGTKQFYEGPTGEGRIVRQEYPSGTKVFCEGPRGQERKVRKEFPDGIHGKIDLLIWLSNGFKHLAGIAIITFTQKCLTFTTNTIRFYTNNIFESLF